MNLAEYARHRGCTRQSVKHAIADGRIPAVYRNGRYDIDATVADAAWNSCTNPRYFEQQGASPSNATEYPSINDSRAKHEYFRALLAELAYESQRQKLVSADQVGQDMAKIARVTRELVLGVPDRIAHLVAAETDASAIHALLTAELTNALREVADGLDD